MSVHIGDVVDYKGKKFSVVRNRDNGMYDLAVVLEWWASGTARRTAEQRYCVYESEFTRLGKARTRSGRMLPTNTKKRGK